MKATIVIVLAFVSVSSFCHAQGTVNFANAGAGLNAPVHLETISGALAGAGYMAQLLVDTGGGSFTAVGNAVNFIGAAAPGYFNGGVVTVSQVAPGALDTFQIFAWDSATVITTYAQALTAWNAGQLRGGYGGPVTIATGGAGTPPSVPASLVGLQPWFLVGETIIPEPSVVLLGLFGAVALLLRRRQERGSLSDPVRK